MSCLPCKTVHCLLKRGHIHLPRTFTALYMYSVNQPVKSWMWNVAGETCSKLTGTRSIHLCVSQRSYRNALHLSVLGNSRLSEWMTGMARSLHNLQKHQSHSAPILTLHLSQNRWNSIGNTSLVLFCFFFHSAWNPQVHLMMPLQPPTPNAFPNSKILRVA